MLSLIIIMFNIKIFMPSNRQYNSVIYMNILSHAPFLPWDDTLQLIKQFS